jgi:hypothetical protein
VPFRCGFGVPVTTTPTLPTAPADAYGPHASRAAYSSTIGGLTITTAASYTNTTFTSLVTIDPGSASRISVTLTNCLFLGGLTIRKTSLTGVDCILGAPTSVLTIDDVTGTWDHWWVYDARAGGVVVRGASTLSMSNWTVRPAVGYEAQIGVSVESASGVALKACDVQGFTTAAIQLNGTTATDVQSVVVDQDASGNEPIIGGTVRLWKSKLSGVQNATFKGDATNAFDLGSTDIKTALCVSPVCLYNQAENPLSIAFGSVHRTMEHVVDLGHDLPLYWSPYTEHVVAPIAATAVSGGVQITSGASDYDTDGVTPIMTAIAHGLVTGDVVKLRNMSTWIGGGTSFTVTVIDSTNIKLTGATLTTAMPVLASFSAPWPDLILVTPASSSLSSRGYLDPGQHPIGAQPADDGTADPPKTGLPTGVTCTVGTNGKLTYANTSGTPYVFEAKAFTHDSLVRLGVTGTTQQMQSLKLSLTGPFIFRRCLRRDVAAVYSGSTTIVVWQDCWLMATNINLGAVTAFSDAVSNWWTKTPTTPFYDGKILASDKFEQIGATTGSVTYDRCWGAYQHDDHIQIGSLARILNTQWMGGDALGTPAHGPHSDMLSFGAGGSLEFENSAFHAGGHSNVWSTSRPVGGQAITFRHFQFTNTHHDVPGVLYTGTTRGIGPTTFGLSGGAASSTAAWTFSNGTIDSQPLSDASFTVSTTISFSAAYWSGTGGGHTDGDAIIQSGLVLA